jgi:hypothetical protein
MGDATSLAPILVGATVAATTAIAYAVKSWLSPRRKVEITTGRVTVTIEGPLSEAQANSIVKAITNALLGDSPAGPPVVAATAPPAAQNTNVGGPDR